MILIQLRHFCTSLLHDLTDSLALSFFIPIPLFLEAPFHRFISTNLVKISAPPPFYPLPLWYPNHSSSLFFGIMTAVWAFGLHKLPQLWCVASHTFVSPHFSFSIRCFSPSCFNRFNLLTSFGFSLEGSGNLLAIILVQLLLSLWPCSCS